MLRSLLSILCLAANPLLAAIVSVGSDDGNCSWWKDGSTSPYSFGALDTDGDGHLTTAEMDKAREQFAIALKETKVSLMAAVDRDNSGKISLYERAEAMPRWVSLRERARNLAIAGTDRDGDGKITAFEARALEERIFTVFIVHNITAADSKFDKSAGQVITAVNANLDQSDGQVVVEAAIGAIMQGHGTLFTLCDLDKNGQLSGQEVSMAFELLTEAAGR